MAAEGSAWQEGVLRWLASAAVASAPSAALGLAAFSAVLRLPPEQQQEGPGGAAAAAAAADASRAAEFASGRAAASGGYPLVGGDARSTASAMVLEAAGVRLGVAGGLGTPGRWWVEDAASTQADLGIDALTRGEII